MTVNEIKGKYTTATPHNISGEISRRLNLTVQIEIIDKGDNYQIKSDFSSTYGQVNDIFIPKQTVRELEGDITTFICNLIMERIREGKKKKIDSNAPLGGW